MAGPIATDSQNGSQDHSKDNPKGALVLGGALITGAPLAVYERSYTATVAL